MSDEKKPTEELNTLEQEFRNFWAKLQDGGAGDAKEKFEAQLRTSPWAILGIVGLVGAVLGYVLGTRGRK